MDTALLTLKSLQLRGQKKRAFSDKKALSIGEILQTPRMTAREDTLGSAQTNVRTLLYIAK